MFEVCRFINTRFSKIARTRRRTQAILQKKWAVNVSDIEEQEDTNSTPWIGSDSKLVARREDRLYTVHVHHQLNHETRCLSGLKNTANTHREEQHCVGQACICPFGSLPI